MSQKPKVRIYPGTDIFKSPSHMGISYIAEKLTKITGAVAAISFFISLCIGLIIAHFYFREFGIPYLDIANTEDYVRASLSKFHIVFPFIVGLTTILLIPKKFLSFKNLVLIWHRANYFEKLIMVISAVMLIILLIFIIMLSTPLKKYLPVEVRGYKPREWEEYSRNYGDSVKGIKSGHNGIVTIEYGKDLKSVDCLALITQAGTQTYFWSLKNDSLFAINTSHLISMHVLLPIKPHPPGSNRKTKGRRYPSKSHFLKSEYGRLVMNWIKTKESVCPSN
ncbi:hypothetical protein KUL42_10190 [Alteromonas sp. KUL42]|uniref:hypothetical protein n=1 Tax=Alteromonas sp. KUL42 TaxID=2480797 RepID=UPI0010366C4A|nr:hypothetical protein [Alteromonas sp. KUL42]TAP37805.1 hypothetical protein EYR97_05055 [Alteromonas sp. KUL42]GEA06258.1 hypothetical protein KUL42_10190 [Alteromonas sp. KUL42]